MGYDIEKEKREAIEAGRRALNSLQAAKLIRPNGIWNRQSMIFVISVEN